MFRARTCKHHENKQEQIKTRSLLLVLHTMQNLGGLPARNSKTKMPSTQTNNMHSGMVTEKHIQYRYVVALYAKRSPDPLMQLHMDCHPVHHNHSQPCL